MIVSDVVHVMLHFIDLHSEICSTSKCQGRETDVDVQSTGSRLKGSYEVPLKTVDFIADCWCGGRPEKDIAGPCVEHIIH